MAVKTGKQDGVDYTFDADVDPPTLEIGGKPVQLQRNRVGKLWTPEHPHMQFDSLEDMARALIKMRRLRGV